MNFLKDLEPSLGYTVQRYVEYNARAFDVYKTLVEKTIRLYVKKDEFGLTGHSVDGEEIEVSINQTTYNKFEEGAEKFGLSVDEALASLLYGRLMRLNDCYARAFPILDYL